APRIVANVCAAPCARRPRSSQYACRSEMDEGWTGLFMSGFRRSIQVFTGLPRRRPWESVRAERAETLPGAADFAPVENPLEVGASRVPHRVPVPTCAR